jgi:uncharacterized sodium:solute symporter family permease YidK
MIGVTFFGLLLTPVFYVAIQGLTQRSSASKTNQQAAKGDNL